MALVKLVGSMYLYGYVRGQSGLDCKFDHNVSPWSLRSPAELNSYCAGARDGAADRGKFPPTAYNEKQMVDDTASMCIGLDVATIPSLSEMTVAEQVAHSRALLAKQLEKLDEKAPELAETARILLDYSPEQWETDQGLQASWLHLCAQIKAVADAEVAKAQNGQPAND